MGWVVWIRSVACALIVALGSLAVAPSAFATAPAAEIGLATRYAPVVKLAAAPAECGPGDPYVPIDVNVLFDEPTVALRGPWGGADLIKVAPSAADLAHGLYEYHLDFPGNALSPGCGYIDWSRRITTGHAPTVYAHVATDPDHPGEIALQYWMFYVFNDWNNLHEGDWEMIQLNFHAGTPAQALATTPYQVGYSQHEGAEGSSWTDPKLEKVDGTHPVVYPAAGSHANFYSSELYLGASGSQGVGCDDTRNADLTLKPTVATIPSAPATALADFPWIGFEGRWGELQPAFFNGPTGPNLKTSWTHPITWSQDWRDRAYAVPAGGVLGTATTDFFCGAMRHGSRLLWRVVSHPVPTVAGVLLALVLVLYLLSRARWRPAAPLRLARRRSWGQILAAATRMYISRFRLFLGIGLLALPISVVITLIQGVVLQASSVVGVENEGGAAGFLVMLGVAIGTAFTLLGLGLVQAATARALIEIDSDRPVGPVQAYGMVVGTVRPLLGALVAGVVAVSILLSSVFLIPIAIWLAVRWSLLVPAVELENRRALGALGRSNQLVSRGWLKVGSLTVAAAAVVLAAGPLIGTLLIVFTSVPLSLLNLIAGLVYVVAMPFVALTTMYVYFDARVRDQLSPKAQAGKLPPEIDLSAARPS
jgi:hypothetical protein